MAQSARLISELRKNLLALNSGTDAVSSSLRRLRPTSACCLVPNWIACTCGTQSCSRRNIARRGSEEHTSELQSLMRISYAVFCLTKQKYIIEHHQDNNTHT